MKLSQDQIQKIEMYLNFKELTQIDLRNEVLDHMANGIEIKMAEQKMSFNDALNFEIDKWNPELMDYSSLWLDWAWVGPKIMMRKCIKKTKEMYFRTLIGALILFGLFYLIFQVFDKQTYETFNQVLGIGYLIILTIIFVFFIKIKSSGYDSSYRYLFKIHAIGFAFLYLVYNPLWADFMGFSKEGTLLFYISFAHSLAISFFYTFWDLYKEHVNSKKIFSCMRLSDNEIEDLFAFVRKHYVEHYDLQTELVDHLANGIEEQWKEYPERSYKDARLREFRKFGVGGFDSVIRKRSWIMEKRYWKHIFRFFKEFFKLPKVLLLIGSILLVFQLIRLIPIGYKLYSIIGFLFIVFGLMMIRAVKNRKSIGRK